MRNTLHALCLVSCAWWPCLERYEDIVRKKNSGAHAQHIWYLVYKAGPASPVSCQKGPSRGNGNPLIVQPCSCLSFQVSFFSGHFPQQPRVLKLKLSPMADTAHIYPYFNTLPTRGINLMPSSSLSLGLLWSVWCVAAAASMRETDQICAFWPPHRCCRTPSNLCRWADGPWTQQRTDHSLDPTWDRIANRMSRIPCSTPATTCTRRAPW